MKTCWETHDRPFKALSAHRVFFVIRSSDDQHAVILSKIHMFFLREREKHLENMSRLANIFCPLVHSQNAGIGLGC